jgi:hypothetical protein
MPESLDEILIEIDPLVRARFDYYEIAPQCRERILDRACQVYLRKAKDIADPRAWLLAQVGELIRREVKSR